MSKQDLRTLRLEMVKSQLVGRGIRDERLLAVMRELPRERFLPAGLAEQAYEDRALPTAHRQTISQPFVVALMTEALGLESHHRVLEVGTGTGYQTAILAHLSAEVYTIERISELSEAAEARLAALEITNIAFRTADGSVGWADHAPYDRIIVTAAAPEIVRPLVDQLVECGRLVMPVGRGESQRLTVVERHRGKIVERPMIAVRFVRLIGEAGFEG